MCIVGVCYVWMVENVWLKMISSSFQSISHPTEYAAISRPEIGILVGRLLSNLVTIISRRLYNYLMACPGLSTLLFRWDLMIITVVSRALSNLLE